VTARALLDDLPGIVGFVLTDEEGRMVQTTGAVEEPELAAAQVAMMVRDMGRLAATLGLGPGELVTIQGVRARRVIALQRGAIVAIELGPKRQIAEVERLLRGCDWAPAEEGPPAPVVLHTSTATATATASVTETVPAAPTAQAVPTSPAQPPPERNTVFAGDLQLFCVPDILEFLRTGQRTGTLTFRSAASYGVVKLRRGRIASALSPRVGGIGDYLVRFGELHPATLREVTGATDSATPPDAVVARLLLERGLVTDEDLRAALLARVCDAIGELVTWFDGRFAFDPSSPVEPLLPGLDLDVDSQPLLLNIFREQDESSRTA